MKIYRNGKHMFNADSIQEAAEKCDEMRKIDREIVNDLKELIPGSTEKDMANLSQDLPKWTYR